MNIGLRLGGLAFVIVAHLAWSQVAVADGESRSFTLRMWNVAAECPSQEWFTEQVEAHLARRYVDPTGLSVSVRIAVEPDQGFVLSLVVQTKSGVGQRLLAAPTCSEVAEAAAVIVASSVTTAGASVEVSKPSNGSFSDATQGAGAPVTGVEPADTVAGSREDLDPAAPTPVSADVPTVAQEDDRPALAREDASSSSTSSVQPMDAPPLPLADQNTRWGLTAAVCAFMRVLPDAALVLEVGPYARLNGYELGLLASAGTASSSIELLGEETSLTQLGAAAFGERWWRLSPRLDLGWLVHVGATRISASFGGVRELTAWSFALSSGPDLAFRISGAWQAAIGLAATWMVVPAEFNAVEATVPLDGWRQPRVGARVGLTLKRSF